MAAYDPNALRMPGAAVMIATAIFGYMFGFFGALASGLGMASAGSLIMSRTYKLRCKGCKISIPSRLLSDGEKRTISDGKMMLLIRAGGFAVGAVIFAGVWIAFVSSRKAETEAPNIADLEAKRDIPGLIAALGEPKIKYDAARALSRLGPETVSPLAAVMKCDDPDRKLAALVALSNMTPDIDEAIDPLIETVKNDENDQVREKAVWVLGKAKGKAERAIPVLEPLINDEKLSHGALQSLKWIDPKTDWWAKKKKTAK